MAADTASSELNFRDITFLAWDGQEAKRTYWSFGDDDVKLQDVHETQLFSVQVYTLAALTQDLSTITSRLAGSDTLYNGPSLVFDFYQPVTSLYHAVEHQRQEISFRATKDDSEASVLEIRKIAVEQDEPRDYGFCIVLTSESWIASAEEHDAVDSEGPILMWYNRSILPYVQEGVQWTEENLRKYFRDSEADSDTEDDILSKTTLGTMSDRTEVRIHRVQRVSQLNQKLPALLNQSYGSDETAHSEPDDHHAETGAFEISSSAMDSFLGDAEQQLQPSPNLTVKSFQSEAVVKVLAHNQVDGSENSAWLRYTIFVPATANGHDLKHQLERLASVLVTDLLGYLPSDATVYFTFQNVPQLSLGAFFEAAEQDAGCKTPAMGILVDGQRLPPAAAVPWWCEPFRYFALALDGAEFTKKPAILMHMYKGGKPKLLPGSEAGLSSRDTFDYDEGYLLRCPNMRNLALRLSTPAKR